MYIEQPMTTSALSKFNWDGILKGVRDALARQGYSRSLTSLSPPWEAWVTSHLSRLSQKERDHYNQLIFPIFPEDTQVPPFQHPLLLKEDSDKKDNPGRIIIDCRPFVTKGELRGQYTLRSRTGIEFAVLRALLSYQWGDESVRQTLSMQSEVHMKLFTYWISSMMTRNMGLEPGTVATVNILLGYYWLWLFRPTEHDETMVLQRGKKIAATFRMDLNQVLSVLDSLQEIPVPLGLDQRIHYLVSILKVGTQSIRFEQVSVSYLYTLLSGSWFGSVADVGQLVACALEHPPTFLAMLIMAQGREMHTTVIARTVKTFLPVRDASQFNQALLATLEAI